MSTRPTDPRGADRRGSAYRIEVYYDDDNGWCAEITEPSARRKA